MEKGSTASATSRRTSTLTTDAGGFGFGRNHPKKVNQLELKKLGLIDQNGKPKEALLIACKVLKIDLKDLEEKKELSFLNKLHDEYYNKGGAEGLKDYDIAQMAEHKYKHYSMRRKLKIKQLAEYVRAMRHKVFSPETSYYQDASQRQSYNESGVPINSILW